MGRKPNNKIRVGWSSNFAYAIGLLVTDGCLSNDGRHIIFVSKDLDQINNFLKCLKINVKIGNIISGDKKSNSYRIQFGDQVIFFTWFFYQRVKIILSRYKKIFHRVYQLKGI